jgi:hypothetical protein
MSLAASESQLSLWSLGSAPLILGTDLSSAVTNAYGTSTGLTKRDSRLLTNAQVIKVDHDSIDASRIALVGTPGRKAGRKHQRDSPRRRRGPVPCHPAPLIKERASQAGWRRARAADPAPGATRCR